MGKSKRAREQNQANSQAAQMQADAAMQVAQMQSDAAMQAAQLGHNAALGAAGMMSASSDLASGRMYEASVMSLEEQKRQYEEAKARLQPYQDLGDEFLPVVRDAATTEGYAERLSEIMDTDIFADLQQERMGAASSMLGQAGLSRSGAAARAASDLTAQTAMSIDDRLYGRQFNNVNVGQAAASMQANMGMNYANQTSNIMTTTAANMGNVTMAGAAQGSNLMMQGAQMQANGLNNAAYYSGQGIMGAANAQAGALVGNANNTAQMYQNRTNVATSLISAYFMSDETLKENMKPIGKIKDLTLYEWDWKKYADNVMGCEMQTGFKAQEVQIKYPDCVKTLHGILVINYEKLYKKLDKAMNKTKRAIDYKYQAVA